MASTPGVGQRLRASAGVGWPTLVLAPPTAGLGTVVVAAATAYEYREEIGQALAWAGDKVGDAADAAGQAAAGAATAADAVSSTAETVGAALGDLNPFGS